MRTIRYNPFVSMAQSESFFGQRRGSTKSLTFQRRDGKQITQDRKEHVRDARTVDQVQHRCLLHTTIDACTWLAPLFGFAWQGAKTKQRYQDNFRRANYDIIRNAALSGNAGYTYSPYKSKSAPVGYFQIAGGELPYHGHLFGNAINGVDYTETEFINYTAEGESWFSLLSSVGLKVKDTLLLVIIFRNPTTGQMTFDTAKVILNDVADVTIGQQAANSLVTVQWLQKNHNWTVINNANRILSLRLLHSDYNPSTQVLFIACFQYKKQGSKMAYSTGRLWHWNDNVEGLTFDEALATYPMNGSFRPDEHPVPEEIYVDMGLPSGLLWATRNVDVTQKNGFAVSPYQYESSFVSWGNIKMYNPNTQNNFVGVYNWGSVNAQEPWYDGQPYGDTPGCQLQTNIDAAHDCATQILGGRWRLPKSEEFKELFDNCEYIDANGDIVTAATSVAGNEIDKRITMNGIVGIRVRSKINGRIIFIPASGYGDANLWSNKGVVGNYWSSTRDSNRDALYLNFHYYGVFPENKYYRYFGMAIRPVMEPPSRKGGGNPTPDSPKLEK